MLVNVRKWLSMAQSSKRPKYERICLSMGLFRASIRLDPQSRNAVGAMCGLSASTQNVKGMTSSDWDEMLQAEGNLRPDADGVDRLLCGEVYEGANRNLDQRRGIAANLSWDRFPCGSPRLKISTRSYKRAVLPP